MLTPTIIGVLLPLLILIVGVMSAIRILPEYERGVQVTSTKETLDP